jgi:hypothetical protein
MSRHIAGRRKKVARLRQQIRVEYLLIAVMVAGFLAFQTWSEHRLDTLRRQRIEFEGRIDAARADLSAASLEFTRESAQDRIVARAKAELGFVDSRIGTRIRLALPAATPGPDEPMLWRLASGLDRFGGIRGAAAAEDSR